MKISSSEASRLIIILIISKLFFWDINRFVETNCTAAWISSIICTIVAIAAFLIINWFYQKSDKEDIFDIVKTSFGNIGLLIFGMTLFFMQLIEFVIILRTYCNTISTITLVYSPYYFILIFIIATVIASAKMGIDNLIKLSSASSIVIIVSILALIILNIPNYDITNLFPILGNGPTKLLQSFEFVGFFNEIIFIFFLIPYLKNRDDVKKIGVKSITISGVIIILTTLAFTLIFPYPINTQFYLPMLQISSSVNVSVIFQRAESIFLVLWIFTCFIYSGALFCFMLFTFKKTFKIKDEKALIPALIVISISLIPIYKNINSLNPMYNFLFYAFSVILFAILPIIFFVNTIRRKNAR